MPLLPLGVFVELKSLTDYRNVDITISYGTTTIGREEITEEFKEYLLENFPDDFIETSEEKEAADLAERLRIEAIQKANLEEERPYNPFDSDPMTAKTVEDISTPEDGMEITNNDAKAKTKKK